MEGGWGRISGYKLVGGCLNRSEKRYWGGEVARGWEAIVGRRTGASGINGHQLMNTGQWHPQQRGMLEAGGRLKVPLGEGWHEKRKGLGHNSGEQLI